MTVKTPSNPATAWISGSETESFTFSCGAFPFYAVIQSHRHIAASVMLFANSPEHVRTILQDMISFGNECIAKYIEAKPEGNSSDITNHRLNAIKQAVNGDEGDYTLTIERAPVNQMFKVAWASNDTIL